MTPERDEHPTEGRDPAAAGSRPETPHVGGYAQSFPGGRVGRYLLRELLGQGGMGRVYAAYDPILKREVALKLLGRDDPLMLVRFLLEAQFQARLDHPAICRVFEVGTDEELPYIAMERIHGEDLLHTQAELALPQLLEVLAEIAEAIEAAHEAGLIHRDIKPGNVLLEQDHHGHWRPRVLDFGLARDLEGPGMTVGSGVLGTPAYMAPEQAMGEPATAKSDIYALGATYFAFLTGRPPFQAHSASELLALHRDEESPALCRLKPDLPKELETILRKCLEKEPHRRYESAQALAEDLRRLQSGEPILAKPPSISFRARRVAKRHQSLLLSATLLLPVALLAGWGLRERHLGQLHLAATHTFDQELRDLEAKVRFAHTAPLHDIRAELKAVRQRLETLEMEIAKASPSARGPGHHAIGQGYLLLRDYERARQHFQQAWDGGERGARTAYGLGRTLASLYEEKQNVLWQLPATDPQRKKLESEFRDPAIHYLRLGQGAAAESPSYPLALIATCEGRRKDALALALAAQRELPWDYENLLLEARLHIGGLNELRADTTAFAQSVTQAEAALAKAAVLGRSDAHIYAAMAEACVSQAAQDSEQGRPTGAIFERSFALTSQALTINPENQAALQSYLVTVIRYGFFLLQMGQDPRPELNKARVLALPMEGKINLRLDIRDSLAIFSWIECEYNWRHGLDPFGPLADAEKRERSASGPGGPNKETLVELLSLKGQIRSERGLDPAPDLDEGIACTREFLGKDQNFPYGLDILGEAHLARAAHEIRHERSGSPWLPQAIAALNRCLTLSPRMVYGRIALAQARLLEAVDRAHQGADPNPSLESALAEARRAVAVRPDYHRALQVLAEVLLAQGEHSFAGNGDPSAQLQELETVCRKGLTVHPRHFAFAQLQGRARMLAARSAARLGGNPRPSLEAAQEALARACTWKKTDAASFREAARVHQMGILLKTGQTARDQAAATKLLERALQLHPCDPETTRLQTELRRLGPL